MRIFNANFLAEKNKRACAPKNLLTFGFATPVYLSDQDITPPGGPAHVGLVKSWGFIDSSAAQVPGRSLVGRIESSDLQLTIINSSTPRFTDVIDPFDPIEGVTVTLYQWFVGTDYAAREVIFRGVVRGQTQYNEIECSLTVEGIWSKYNRTIGADLLIDTVTYPDADPDDVGRMGNICYGVIKKAQARAVDSGAVDNLAAAMDASQTTVELSDVLGFPASGTVGIDDEEISYSGISGDTLTGCTRGANSTTATTHASGSVCWEISTEFVYQVASHPVQQITEFYVDNVRVTALAALYTGQPGAEKPGYEGTAVAVLPARITRQQAVDLLVNDGLTIDDAVEVIDGIGFVDGITISDAIGVTTGSHTHTGIIPTATLIPTSATLNGFVNPSTNVYDQSDVTYVHGYVTGLGSESVRANFPAYTGPPPTAVYMCVTHKSWVADNGGGPYVKLGSTNLDHSNTYVTQKISNGAVVPSSFTISIGAINTGSAADSTVYEMWLEIQSDSTGASGADGVAKFGTVEKIGVASMSGTVTKQGTVTRIGAVTLTGNSVADVEIGKIVTATMYGWADDPSGTITGTPGQLLSRPDHVIKHLISHYCVMPLADLGASFNAAGAFFAANNYNFAVLINTPIQASDLLMRLGVQCRSRYFVSPAGQAQLIVRQLGQPSVKSVGASQIRRSSMSIRRSAAGDLVNTFNVLYNRDWQLSGDDAYQAAATFNAPDSVAKYGIMEPTAADLLHFDAVTDPAMVAHVADFWQWFLQDSRRLPGFSVFLDNMDIEPGDVIDISHPLDSLVGFTCEVIKVRHVLGSARRQIADRVEILAVDNVQDVTDLRFSVRPGTALIAGSVESLQYVGGLFSARAGRSNATGYVANIIQTAGELAAKPGASLVTGTATVMLHTGGVLVPLAGDSPSTGTTGTLGIGLIIYATAHSDDIYKQETGSFVAQGAGAKYWRGVVASSITGDVYAGNALDDVYKQTGGTGAFVALGLSTADWRAIGINSVTGDVYAAIYGGDIYKQTGGTGAFVALGQTSRLWLDIAVNHITGDVYAAVQNGDIYKQTGGTGAFVAQGWVTRKYFGVAVNSKTGDVYASVYGEYVYRNGINISGSVRNWTNIDVHYDSGSVYVGVNGGDIYKQANGAGSFIGIGAGTRAWMGVAVLS